MGELACRTAPLGLPADFLIAGDGRILACKYGQHAYDQWSLDEVLALAARETLSRGEASSQRSPHVASAKPAKR